ncbi:hypothetical protein [Hymenobacter ruricola]|uniref:Uncharacterized protein n=1 Tax=Hymenobacter ruricola TaxID=2791023 RepID=A0ABS0I764_9BACT|nr:hypothetical protein [Hymenobacter ruricola]MBF9222811.1 hypothetical protein [Hymenobacter ruricola]
MNYDALFSNNLPALPKSSSLGGVQHDIFFSVMKVIHRQNQPLPVTQSSDKVARLSCVCRLSELMPLVRQMHDEARARHQAQLQENTQQAA